MYLFQVADDHPLFRSAILEVIKRHYPDSSVNLSKDLEGTLLDLDQNPDTDLLLLDIYMPGSQDLFGLISVRQRFPSVPVAVISSIDNTAIINRVMSHGACGFIPKTSTPLEIFQAVEVLLKGFTWLPEGFKPCVNALGMVEKDLASKLASLTPQQYRVLCYLREGWLNKQIGYEMTLTEATIKAHITAIFKKLGISNRTQAVIMLNKLALEQVDGLDIKSGNYPAAPLTSLV